MELSGSTPHPLVHNPLRRPGTPRNSDKTTQESYETNTDKGFEAILNQNISLVTTASVCRRWRSAAINSGNLWSKIALDASDSCTITRAELFFERSRSAPLTVYIIDYEDQSSMLPRVQSVVARIAAASERIAQCVLFANSPTLWSYWTHSAPNAHTIVIGGSGGMDVPLFGTELTQLREFVSFFYPVLPPSGLQHLTFLKIHNDGKTVSLDSLLDVLRQSINLKILSLGGFGRWLLTNNTPTTPVSLPNARDLTLTSCDSATFLHHTHLPPPAGIYIIGQPRAGGILSALPEGFSSVAVLPDLDKLSVVFTPGQPFCVSAGNRTGWKVSIEGEGYTRSLVGSSLDAVIQFPPFSTIRTLYFASWATIPGWVQQILNLRCLQNLQVEYTEPDELLVALHSSGTQTGLPALQVLEDLGLHRCYPPGRINPTSLKTLLKSRRFPQLKTISLHEDVCQEMKGLDVGSTWANLLVLKGMFLRLNPLIGAKLVTRTKQIIFVLWRG